MAIESSIKNLSDTDLSTIAWLTEHDIQGSIIYKGKDFTTFHLRKPGMLTHFKCQIHYKEVRLSAYLKLLDKELTKRVEHEARAQQCALLVGKVERILRENMGEWATELVYTKMTHDTRNTDHILPDEALQLINEFRRLFPPHPTMYKEMWKRGYCKDSEWPCKWRGHGFTYWDDYILNVSFRSEVYPYIPRQSAVCSKRRTAK